MYEWGLSSYFALLYHTGVLNFQEFAVGLSMSLKGSFDEKLYWVFNLYDVDGDGYISTHEIKQIVQVWYHF